MRTPKESFPGVMKARLLVLAVVVVIVAAGLFKRSTTVAKPVAANGASSTYDPSKNPALPWIAPERVKVEGWVVDESKHAVVGARVCATSISVAHTDEESGPFCTAVAEDGRFAIEGLPAGRWDVVASANGFVPGRVEPFVDLEAGHAPVEIHVAHGGVPVEGTVEDPLGRPVARAHVRAMATTLSDVTFPDVDTVTDEAGKFSLWVPAGSVDLEAKAEGYAAVDKVYASPTHLAKLALAWEAVVTGRVIDASGAAVAGARVVARGPEEHTVRAGADGSFSFAGLSGGRWRFEAIAPHMHGTLAAVLVDPGHRSDGLVLVAARAALVDAAVLSDDGTPCIDGGLRLADRGTDTVEYAELDAKGHVHFDALSAGTWTVEVECEGKDVRGDRPNLVIGETDVTGLVYRVHDGRTARGVLVDDRGAPIANASISANLDEGGGQWRSVTTKSDGTFVLAGLGAGSWRIEARDNRFADVQSKIDVGTVDVTGLRLVAKSGSSVHGRVIDASGVGIAHVDVQIEGTSYHSAVTGDDGSFRIRGLTAGSHVIWASKDSAKLTFLVPTQKTDDGEGIAFDASETGETALDLKVAAPNLVIVGRVVDASGAPVVEASVYYRREWHDEEFANEGPDVVLTDGEGRFRITGLPPGNYSLRARKKGAGELLKSHVPAGGIAFFALEPHGSVTVTLAAKLTSVRVKLANSALGLYFDETLVGTDRVRFDDVPAGTYDVSVASDDGAGDGKVTLGKQEDKTVALTVSAWATITGTFDASDKPGVRVSMYCEDCTRSQYAAPPLIGGAFRADHLLPGTYSVEIYDKRMLARGKVVASSGAVATVTFELLPEPPPDEPVVNGPPLEPDEPEAPVPDPAEEAPIAPPDEDQIEEK